MKLSDTRVFGALALALVLTGCATTGSAITEDVVSIRAGVTATREQAHVVFDAGNKLAREQAIDRKVDLPEVTLKEEDFPTPVPAAQAAQWDQAFGVLDEYGAALQKLVAPERAAGAGDAIAGLATQLNSGSLQAHIPATLSGTFAAFGAALVQAKAEKSATQVMQRTDPAFQDVMNGMAGAIGADPAETDTLQFTSHAKWEAILAQMRSDYSALKPTQKAERTKVVKDFVAGLERRDAQEVSLDQLHASLLALGEAHAAAARGKPGDAMVWIQRINGWLDDVKKRVEAAEKAQKGAS